MSGVHDDMSVCKQPRMQRLLSRARVRYVGPYVRTEQAHPSVDETYSLPQASWACSRLQAHVARVRLPQRQTNGYYSLVLSGRVRQRSYYRCTLLQPRLRASFKSFKAASPLSPPPPPIAAAAAFPPLLAFLVLSNVREAAPPSRGLRAQEPASDGDAAVHQEDHPLAYRRIRP